MLVQCYNFVLFHNRIAKEGLEVYMFLTCKILKKRKNFKTQPNTHEILHEHLQGDLQGDLHEHLQRDLQTFYKSFT